MSAGELRISPEGAMELIEQLRGLHDLENGLVDPADWERFTDEDVLRVAAGETTIQALYWGHDVGSDREALEQIEREKLAAWQAAAAPGEGEPR